MEQIISTVTLMALGAMSCIFGAHLSWHITDQVIKFLQRRKELREKTI